MSSESSQPIRLPSNFKADKNVRKKIRPWEREIPFRDFVRFASPRLADQCLAELTGSDPRTARRWLHDGAGAEKAMHALVVNVLSRIRF
jgi:hypothetical protein